MFLPQPPSPRLRWSRRTQRAQRSWDGERGGRWRATTNTGLSRQSLRDHDAAALRHGLSRCATRQRITAASTLRVCRATRARMPSSRHTKTPASQATRIPRQKCREHINHISAEKKKRGFGHFLAIPIIANIPKPLLARINLRLPILPPKAVRRLLWSAKRR